MMGGMTCTVCRNEARDGKRGTVSSWWDASMLDLNNSEFKEPGIWVVKFGNCAFVVDDATGEVTGP